jgi:hypothetical protein
MNRIVVTTLGTLGDLHPTIAIALESQHHGERQQPNRVTGRFSLPVPTTPLMRVRKGRFLKEV